VAPAARVTGVLMALMGAADAAGPLVPVRPLPDGTHELLTDFRVAAGSELSDEALIRGVSAWGALLGALTLELFGHLHRAVTDYDAHFELIIDRIDPTAVAVCRP
jgi:hypothetical protein